jgi:phosphohistidine swiveling domain-containing protein
MNLTIPVTQVETEHRDRVGGKAFSLAVMTRLGLSVPPALCVTTDAYNHYSTVTGLRERILLELNRKSFQEMRWEEMWDSSLRIRNMFLNTPIPADLTLSLKQAMEGPFQNQSVVVRSSAPGEDSSKASFAGLHESYVNVRGVESILEHIRLVWASLWSDGALLYRQELGLDVARSTMAVVVQEIVVGEKSGVIFGKSPNDDSQAMVEAVHGLNAGLVDGVIEPDRWLLSRETGEILSHTPALREKWVVPGPEGTRVETLPFEKTEIPPLARHEISRLFKFAIVTEKEFDTPQDMEWTVKGSQFYILQSRPITTATATTPEDKRPWYLTLRRSFENLKALREKIEGELVPAMIEEAQHLSKQDLSGLSDSQLADEIDRRVKIHERWVGVYWGEFIPFAHGMRLFGQVYNDTVRPTDPYEFMDLLGTTKLASLERNRKLEEMASMMRSNPSLAESLRNGFWDSDIQFVRALDAFTETFGDLSCSLKGGAECVRGKETMVKLLLEMVDHPPAKEKVQPKEGEALTAKFLSHFENDQREFANELLDLGRASYRMRDDDNIYLGRVETQMQAAIDEGHRRLRIQGRATSDALDTADVIEALKNPTHVPKPQPATERTETVPRLKARQILGQPAGPGIARGKARVILNPSNLFDFKSGEILVVDAIDPNMTFIVPISAGIVERRGGMLIHGAIIAREYGLPCVTGVPNATSSIHTGDEVTVDGYLGIVIIG